MWWGVEIVGCTVTLFTVRRVSFTQTIPITAALLGRTVTVWRPSIVPSCLLLNQACISIVSNCYIGLRFSPVLYVTNFLANVWYFWGKQSYSWQYCTVVTMVSSMCHLWQILTDTVYVIDAAPNWRNTIHDGPITDWSGLSAHLWVMSGPLYPKLSTCFWRCPANPTSRTSNCR